MSTRTELTDEVVLPSLEAVLAGTLALMTGYSQALQADQAPGPRLMMGLKIGRNLDLLMDHPAVTEAFRRVMAGLRQRWAQMSACTELAAPVGTGACGLPARGAASEPAPGPDLRFTVSPPARLQ